MRAAKTVGGWLGIGVLAVACNAQPADCVGSREVPVRAAPQLASAPPMAPVPTGSTSPPPRAPKGDLCHIINDGPHRAAFSWNDTAIWSDLLQTAPHDVYVLDSNGAAHSLNLVDGKIHAERMAHLDARDAKSAMGSLTGQENALSDGPIHGPWGDGQIKLDTWDRFEISLWFPGQARQRLHEITGYVWEVTFASHASGVAIVGYGGRYSVDGQEEDPFILRWSKGNTRRRVRESFPGTEGPPSVVIGPDATPWLQVGGPRDLDAPHMRSIRVLRLVKDRWINVGEWRLRGAGYDMVLTPDGDAWLVLGTVDLDVPDEQGGLWRLPLGGRQWERVAPELIGPCRHYSIRGLIPIARNHLMMLTKVQVEGTSSCETRGWATVELRLDDAIDPAFAARCATLPGPASRGASP